MITGKSQFHTCYESSIARGRLGLDMTLGEVGEQCIRML